MKRGTVIAVALAVTAAGCAGAGRPAPVPVPGGLTACLVTDTGGISDRSFNAAAWTGMQTAAQADREISVSYVQARTTADYAPDIAADIAARCGVIITAGFRMGPATSAAVAAHPGQRFIAVDCSYAGGCLTGTPSPRVAQLVYDTVPAAFLGGYLAAGLTRTGTVGEFGGIGIPPVTAYMDGWWDGVQYWNRQHGAHVRVLGWDERTQRGSFSGDFTSQGRARALALRFASQGADIIFPVAGGAGIGAVQAVAGLGQAAGGPRVALEWVDSDGCTSLPQYCRFFATSVTKNIAGTVGVALVRAQQGSFRGGLFTGTLANGGTGLAPFHFYGGIIPVALLAGLTAVQDGIEAGMITAPTQSPVPGL